MKDSCNPEHEEYHKIIMTHEDEKIFRCAKNCYLCKKSFSKAVDSIIDDDDDVKVRDHDHLTGAYRGAAHSKCNTQCRNDRFDMDEFFHDGKNYDIHFIIDAISELCQTLLMDVSCIPLNTEKYL